MTATKKLRKELSFDDESHLQIIEEAARHRGLKFSDFVKTEMLKVSREVIDQKNNFELSDRDWDFLIDVESKEPNEALKKLMQNDRGHRN